MGLSSLRHFTIALALFATASHAGASQSCNCIVQRIADSGWGALALCLAPPYCVSGSIVPRCDLWSYTFPSDMNVQGTQCDGYRGPSANCPTDDIFLPAQGTWSCGTSDQTSTTVAAPTATATPAAVVTATATPTPVPVATATPSGGAAWCTASWADGACTMRWYDRGGNYLYTTTTRDITERGCRTQCDFFRR